MGKVMHAKCRQVRVSRVISISLALSLSPSTPRSPFPFHFIHPVSLTSFSLCPGRVVTDESGKIVGETWLWSRLWRPPKQWLTSRLNPIQNYLPFKYIFLDETNLLRISRIQTQISPVTVGYIKLYDVFMTYLFSHAMAVFDTKRL